MSDEKEIRSHLNQYVGVNPHLNDQLQDSGTQWTQFHNRFIVNLQDAMNARLIERGYVAESVTGLQIATFDENTGDWGRERGVDPDVGVFDKNPNRPHTSGHSGPRYEPGAIAMTIPESTGRTDEEYLEALAIYRADVPRGYDSKPVAWVEVLSPSNKPLAHRPGVEAKDTDWQKYDAKRVSITGEGITLVEIDLVDSSLPLPGLTPYHPIDARKASPLHPTPADQNAPEPHPYYIAVSDPRDLTPDTPHGTTMIYPFDVETQFPEISIPLTPGDAPLEMDFQAAYDQTVAAPHNILKVNYAEKPAHFPDYRTNDQNSIAARMKTIRLADREGQLGKDQKDPLPLVCPVENARLDLDKALREIDNGGSGRSSGLTLDL